jgi:hypothetical protein
MDSGSKVDDEAEYHGAIQIHSYVLILQSLVSKHYLFSICCKAGRITAPVDLKLPNLLQFTAAIKDQPQI